MQRLLGENGQEDGGKQANDVGGRDFREGYDAPGREQELLVSGAPITHRQECQFRAGKPTLNLEKSEDFGPGSWDIEGEMDNQEVLKEKNVEGRSFKNNQLRHLLSIYLGHHTTCLRNPVTSVPHSQVTA